MLLCAAALLLAAGQRGRAAGRPSRIPPPPDGLLRRPPLPTLLRLGERFSIQLHGGLHSEPEDPNRALQLQLSRREEEKEKRSNDPPISVDLTFHLLRQVLQMARAEQLAQQASDNRRMMDMVGKLTLEGPTFSC